MGNRRQQLAILEHQPQSLLLLYLKRSSTTSMASQGGLTRRRGGAAGGGVEDDGQLSRPDSAAPKAGESSRAAESSYTGGENGHKIAFDPKDIGESEERSRQPKLTLMEEVLLMGLKDKQVCEAFNYESTAHVFPGLLIILE